MNNEGKIIIVFPNCGLEDFVKNHDENIKVFYSDDKDIKKYFYVVTPYTFPGELLPREYGLELNPNFPANYIEHIMDLTKRYDYVLINYGSSIRNILNIRDLIYTVVMLGDEELNEFINSIPKIQRYCTYGLMLNTVSPYMDINAITSNSKNYNIHKLKKGEKLSDYIENLEKNKYEGE